MDADLLHDMLQRLSGNNYKGDTKQQLSASTQQTATPASRASALQLQLVAHTYSSTLP